MRFRPGFFIPAFILAGSLPIQAEDPVGPFFDLGPRDGRVSRLLERMSDEEIVAQVFLVGWPSDEPSEEILEWIRTRNLGGVKVFGWNAGNLNRLAETIGVLQETALQTDLSVPLLTATDQEGGWVRHVKGDTAVTPGNMAIGASGLPYDAYKTGYYIGRELRALGINMNFAPTVDVYRNPDAHVIGPRAFGSDPVAAGVLGGAYMRGLEEARVIATAKHFPGHGNAEGDSHGTLPVLDASMQELWDHDLVPYRLLIAEGLPAVLSGHLSFPSVTGNLAPASVSAHFKQGILRRRLGFDGLVITDDLHMGGAVQYAARENKSFADLCLEALRAGSDMILLGETPELNGEIWQTVMNEYRTNDAFRSQLRRSVQRILSLKLRYLAPEDRVPLIPEVAEVERRIPDPEGEAFFRDQAHRSTTIVRDRNLPLELGRGEGVLLVGKDPDFLRIGSQFYPEANTLRIRGGSFYEASAGAAQQFVRTAESYETVIYCLSDPATLSVLRAAEGLSPRISVVSILTPVYLRETPWIDNAVAVYGWGPESLEAAYAVLRGDIDAEGRLPVEIE
ncbi:MAG: glycoside hydrolase family 3 protein [Spirochaetaceae bacterium]